MPRLLTPSKVILLAIFFAIGFVLYKLFDFGAYWTKPQAIVECVVPSKIQSNVLDIAVSVSHILSIHNIQFFLCYESLWGALKNGGLLRWERKVDFCAMNENLVKLDEVFFLRQFQKAGLEIDYDSKTGRYTVWRRLKDEGTVEINLFERLKEMKLVRRLGWRHRLLPPSSDNIDTFPDFLVELPLPKIKFSGREYPAAREGLELQKYHYRDSWWKNVKPENC